MRGLCCMQGEFYMMYLYRRYIQWTYVLLNYPMHIHCISVLVNYSILDRGCRVRCATGFHGMYSGSSLAPSYSRHTLKGAGCGEQKYPMWFQGRRHTPMTQLIKFSIPHHRHRTLWMREILTSQLLSLRSSLLNFPRWNFISQMLSWMSSLWYFPWWNFISQLLSVRHGILNFIPLKFSRPPAPCEVKPVIFSAVYSQGDLAHKISV